MHEALRDLEARIKTIRDGQCHIVGRPMLAVDLDLLEALVTAVRYLESEMTALCSAYDRYPGHHPYAWRQDMDQIVERARKVLKNEPV